jgi:hypothetical protein
MQVQTGDIPHLFNEQRALRELKDLGAMRLQGKRTPDAADGTLTQPAALGHRTCRPMRGSVRALFQVQREYPLHRLVADLPQSPRAGLVNQPLQTPLEKAAPPLAHRLKGHRQTPGHRRIAPPHRAGQHNATTQRQSLGHGVTATPTLQRLALLPAQLQMRNRSPQRHRHLPCTLGAGTITFITFIYDSGH